MTVADLLSASPALFSILALLFGLLVGSFLNVVIYRLPIMMERDWARQCASLAGSEVADDSEPFNLIVPHSRCSSCGAAIRAWQNVPVISYLILRGRCASCRAAIGWRYPFVESLSGLACAIVAWRFGFGWEAMAGIVLTLALVALSGIDIDTQLLPDDIVLPLLWLGLLLSLAAPQPQASTLFIAPADAVLGAAAGYMVLWSVAQLFRLVTGRVGMGNGDFKLLAVFGAWLGWKFLPLIILLSAGVGAVLGIAMIVFRGRDRQLPIPFGPYLAMAGWIAMLYGQDILDAYLHWFGHPHGA